MSLAQFEAYMADVERRTAKVLEWTRKHIHPEAYLQHTGGGCTAIEVPVKGEGADRAYWMITDDSSAPDRLRPDPKQGTSSYCVGFYDWEDKGRGCGRWICFEVPDMYAAARLIKSYMCHEF